MELWDIITGPMISPLLIIAAFIVLYIAYKGKHNKITRIGQVLDISRGIYPVGIEPTLDGSEVGARIRQADGTLVEFKTPRVMGNTGLRARR